MKLDAYRTFTTALLERASAHAAVVGLVALGSMAEIDYGPDEGSDHDFFLVVQPGTEEGFRIRLDWLPRPADIRFHFPRNRPRPQGPLRRSTPDRVRGIQPR